MKIQLVKGTNDVMQPEIKKWRHLENLAKNLFEIYGYSEIRTPIIEHTELFKNSIGDATDIVKKEMFTFIDKASRSITLRPEETASIVRAYLEHKLYKKSKLVKLYYIGPMFRSERPQAGRMRQFYQMGVEAIGSYDPSLDAEIISLMYRVAKEAKLNNISVRINCLGCADDRERYKALLKKLLKKDLNKLCKNCKQRFETNILRILDCINNSCRRIISTLPAITDYICHDCQEHFQKVKQFLSLAKVPFTVDPHLVRGLDYYTRTVFELSHSKLGAKNVICAGGRYDNLISNFGGPEVGACGFAFGLERLILAIDAEDIQFTKQSNKSVYVAIVNNKLKNEAFKLVDKMRAAKITTHFDYQDRSLKAQLRQANKLETKYVVVVGEEELKKNKVVLKDMKNHSQEEIDKANLISSLSKKLI